MTSEFDLIARHLSALGAARPDTSLGVGDDCALLTPPLGQNLAVTTDTLIAGVHFATDCDPEAVGHKTLAVSLSDLAAMGATPAWATLSLNLPQPDETWLAGFCRGFHALAEDHGVQLVGGDTCRGPLSIGLQLIGFVPDFQALRRDLAQPGDPLYVTGTLGDAALGLRVRQGRAEVADPAPLLAALDRPQPRIAEGFGLRGLGRAAIDLSDGLIADLGHLVTASGVGAEIERAALPLSPPVRAWVEASGDWGPVLAGGDDYQLLFAVAPELAEEMEEFALGWSVPATRVGRIVEGSGVRLLGPDGGPLPLPEGYDHFRADG